MTTGSTTTRRLALVLLAALAGCGGKKKKNGGDGPGTGGPTDLPSAPATGPAPIGKFKITGKVTHPGPAESKVMGMNADTATCGTSQPDPASIQLADGKLLNVAVHLEGTPKGADPRGSKPKIDQHKCRYLPYVQTATAGDTLTIGNRDNVLHNVHAYENGDSTLFNASSPAGVAASEDLANPGPVQLKCDVHPWMAAWVWIFDHPYHGSTGETGSFELPAPPPGEYELVAWHEKAGMKKLKVTVPAEGDVTIDVAY